MKFTSNTSEPSEPLNYKKHTIAKLTSYIDINKGASSEALTIDMSKSNNIQSQFFSNAHSFTMSKSTVNNVAGNQNNYNQMVTHGKLYLAIHTLRSVIN